MGAEMPSICVCPPLMLLIITPEAIMADEARFLTSILELDECLRVHLRHPQADDDDISAIVDGIPSALWNRVSIHGHNAVAIAHPGIGVHLSSAALSEGGALPSCAILSGSCHTAAEVAAAPTALSYLTLSPVFDSISKHGYTAAVNTTDPAVRLCLSARRVIALGGMTPERIKGVAVAGFAGAAFLGYVWDGNEAGYVRDGNASLERCRRIVAAAHSVCRNVPERFPSPVHLVTDGEDVATTVEQARQAVRGGCRWVQVRMKDADPADRDAALMSLRDFCHSHGATLIVDDDVQAVCRTAIDGVHLGRNDMDPAEARAILGPVPLIGATVNCAADAERLLGKPIDYIGLGPWRFTTTKRRLAQPLGAQGTHDLVRYIRDLGIRVPILAIGGISDADIPAVLATGADGIAVSSAICHAADPAAAARRILQAFDAAQGH